MTRVLKSLCSDGGPMWSGSRPARGLTAKSSSTKSLGGNESHYDATSGRHRERRSVCRRLATLQSRWSRQRRKYLNAKPLDPEPDQLDPRPILTPVVPEPVHRKDVLFDLAEADPHNVHDHVVFAIELQRE
jgi:hypothetical protein